MKHLENRVAIVTGGASGIGRALCELLAAEGAALVVADINATGAEQVAAAIRKRGHRGEAVPLDVSDETEVHKVVSDVATMHGHLDFMFNNAAIAAVGEFRDANLDDFRRIVDVNLMGVVNGTLAAYRVMLRQKSGHIVNTSSVVGLMPTPTLSAYSATKWAITGFSMAVRAEAAALGVKVSIACPGLVRTNMGETNMYWNIRKEDHLANLPLRWAIEPDQAAKGILRGVARNQELIMFPFSTRAAWWAYRAWPGIFNPLLRRVVTQFRRLRIHP